LISWMRLRPALRLMTYPNERQIVRKAAALMARARGEWALEL